MEPRPSQKIRLHIAESKTNPISINVKIHLFTKTYCVKIGISLEILSMAGKNRICNVYPVLPF